MALLQHDADGPSTITAVGDHWLETAQGRSETSVMLWPEGIAAWPATDLDTLTEAHFEAALATRPQVLLLATGVRLRFPAPALLRALRLRGVGLEVMDHRAAARTYNLLLAEQRRVTALFLIDPQAQQADS